MLQKNEIYRCPQCGNVVEVINAGTCVPQCCGEPMRLMKENTTDGAKEKHVPVIEKTDGGYRVSVGSVEHPMTEAHWITMIELFTDDGVILRKDLTPSDKPSAEFHTCAKALFAREYCNLHGLWRADEGE